MKNILLASILTMCCTAGYAQVRELPAKRTTTTTKDTRGTHKISVKKNTFYAGPKLGLVMSTMSNPEECTLAKGAGANISLGAVAHARFGMASKHASAGTGLFGAGIELKYKNNTVKTFGTDEDGNKNASLTVGYFELPVFVRVYPFYKSDAVNTLYVEAGPDFALGISRGPKNLTVENPNPEMSSITYHIKRDKEKLVGNDVRVMIGAGYDLPIKKGKDTKSLVGIGARYYIGTSGLAGNFPCRMNSFEFSLSWQFSLGKL